MKHSENTAVNFSQDEELDYILFTVLKKGKTKKNKMKLREIGKDFKKANKGMKLIENRAEFYSYVRKHFLFKLFEKIEA